MNSQTTQSTGGLAGAVLDLRWPSSMTNPSTLPDASTEGSTSDVELSRRSHESGHSTATSLSSEPCPKAITQKQDDSESAVGVRPNSAADALEAMVARYEEFLDRSQQHGGDSSVVQDDRNGVSQLQDRNQDQRPSDNRNVVSGLRDNGQDQPLKDGTSAISQPQNGSQAPQKPSHKDQSEPQTPSNQRKPNDKRKPNNKRKRAPLQSKNSGSKMPANTTRNRAQKKRASTRSGEYEVLRLGDVRLRPNGAMQFKVCWAPTWMPLEDLRGNRAFEEAESLALNKFGQCRWDTEMDRSGLSEAYEAHDMDSEIEYALE